MPLINKGSFQQFQQQDQQATMTNINLNLNLNATVNLNFAGVQGAAYPIPSELDTGPTQNTSEFKSTQQH